MGNTGKPQSFFTADASGNSYSITHDGGSFRAALSQPSEIGLGAGVAIDHIACRPLLTQTGGRRLHPTNTQLSLSIR